MQVLDYYKAVDVAVRKYAKYKTEEEQKDIRQTAYLALLEAGGRIKNIKIAYLCAKDSVLQSLYRGQDTLIVPESLSDPAVLHYVDKTRAQESDVSDTMDMEVMFSAMEKLPDNDRWILELTSIGWTIEEIAEFMEKPVIWVNRGKQLAIKKMQKILGIKR